MRYHRQAPAISPLSRSSLPRSTASKIALSSYRFTIITAVDQISGWEIIGSHQRLVFSHVGSQAQLAKTSYLCRLAFAILWLIGLQRSTAGKGHSQGAKIR